MSDVKLLLLIAALLALLVASNRRPIVALLFFLALVYIRPGDDRPNLADLHLPLVLQILLAALYLSRSYTLKQWFPDSTLIGPFLVFFMLMGISSVLGVDPENSYAQMSTFSVGAVTFLFVQRLVSNENDLKLMFWLMLICGVIFVYYAVFKGSDCLMTQDGFACGRRNFSKVNRNFGPPNYLGLNLVIMLNLAYGLFLTFRKKYSVVIFIVAMASFVWVIMLTNSRGAFVAFGASLLFYWMISPFKLRGVLILLSLILGIYWAAPESALERMDTLWNIQNDESAMHRIDLWEIAFDLIQHHPMLGIGIGNFEHYAPNSPHNAFVQIGSEMGIPALMVWMWLVMRALVGLMKVRNEQKNQKDSFLAIAATTTLGSLVALLVQACTTGLAHREFVYVMLALAGVIIMLHRQSRTPVQTQNLANVRVDAVNTPC